MWRLPNASRIIRSEYGFIFWNFYIKNNTLDWRKIIRRIVNKNWSATTVANTKWRTTVIRFIGMIIGRRSDNG